MKTETVQIYYKSPVGTVRDTVFDDLPYLANYMRLDDREEIWATGHYSPLEALLKGFNKSTSCLTAECEGLPVIIFGIVPDNFIGVRASIWMLSTDRLLTISNSFLRNSSKFVKHFLEIYPQLYNYVDVRNEKSIEWLKWLGAEFGSIIPYGIDNKPFQYFQFTKEGII